jgi:regulator of protease activity HflC (stomatin/prohibitin superfamily)
MQLLVIGIILIVIGVATFLGRRQILVQNQPLPAGVPVLAGLVGLGLLFASTLVIVPPGHIGVKVFFGKVQPNPLSEGLHVVNPLVTIEKLSIRTNVYTMSSVASEGQVGGDDSIKVLSQGGLTIPLDVSVAWRLVADDAPGIFRTLGRGYEESIIRAAARAALRDAAQRFTAQEAYSSKREELASQAKTIMESKIKELLAKQENFTGAGFVIQQVLLRNVSLPPRLRAAIEEKLAAEQEAQRMDFVLQKETKEAQRKKIEAQGIADFQKIVSEGISEQLLKWKGIEATMEIAKSHNAKVVIVGTSQDSLPVILNADE